jgi:serine/threonine protein kinase
MATPELCPGDLVHHQYLIQKKLGEGGFGRTYLATNQHAYQESCVLKELVFNDSNPQTLRKAQELFHRECELLYQLNHEQIPKFRASFVDQGRSFLVQEYIEGKTYTQLLEERRQKGRSFSEAEVTQFLQNLLPVLSYIHSKKIIHRDIAPDNIIYPERSKPKLIDFGVARQVVTQLRVNSFTSSVRAATVVSKEGYSPEELRKGQAFPCSDLYALGVTSIVLLTGKYPIELFDGYRLQWKWRPDATVSDRLAQVLDRMLDAQPQNRYQTAQEALDALTPKPTPPVRAQSAVSPSPPSSTKLQPRFSKKWTLVLVSSILIWVLQSLGSRLVVNQASRVPILCSWIETCVSDKQYQAIYDRAKGQIREVQSQGNEAKTVVGLEATIDGLTQPITELRKIPQDAPVYPDAQTELQSAEKLQQEFQSRVPQEKTAAKFLEQAKLDAKQAAEIQKEQTIDSYKSAKLKWEAAISNLNQVVPGSFVYAESQELKKDYQAQQEEAEGKIVELKTPPKVYNPPPVESPTYGLPDDPQSQDYNPPTDPQPQGYDPPPPPERSPEVNKNRPSVPALPSCDTALYGACQ